MSSVECLACGRVEARLILDFGPQAAANLLTEGPDEAVRKETLALRYCDACGHAQQDYFYPPDELFSTYAYQSGTSGTLIRYFEWLASVIGKGAPKGASLLEIASNDGSFLKCFAGSGIDVVGVEPAGNLVEVSRAAGVRTIHGFWPEAAPAEPVSRIVAMNVLAHGPDPLGFLSGVRRALADDGIAYIQVSQADMFRNFEFDTLYHEHYSFFCPASLRALAERAGFSHWRFCKTDIHGGSILAVLGMSEAAVRRAGDALAGEGGFSLGLLHPDDRPHAAAAAAFQARALETCRSIRTLAGLAREAGLIVVLVGAAAKAVTVLQVSGMKPDLVVDEAPLKIGRYLPGEGMRIEALTAVAAVEGRCLFIIGAWNFRIELSGKLKALRGDRSDIVMTYFPGLSAATLA